jgi:hypothetical protein
MTNALNLKELNQEQCLNLLRFTAKTGSNIFLFGQKGTGKTAMSLQTAAECGLSVIYLNLSSLERGDLLGIPNAFDSADVITYKSPYFLPKLKKGEKATKLLLLDEIDKCASELTHPLLEILQFRTLNAQALNIVACVATGNLPTEQVFANTISSALLDRASKYVLSFDFKQWLAWARSQGLHELVLGFLCRNPNMACGSVDSIAYADPSPRGWTQVSNAIQQAEKLNFADLDTLVNLVAGYVGAQAALQFEIWLKHYKRFDAAIHSMLEGRGSVIKYGDLDQTSKFVYCLTACHLAREKCLSGKGKPKFRYLESLCQFFDQERVEPDLQLISLRNSFPMDTVVLKHNLIACQPFFEKVSAVNDRVI